MIFQELHKFAQREHLLDAIEFTSQKIRFSINIDINGIYKSISPLGNGKEGLTLDISKIPSRNSRAIACLGADTLDRVLPGFNPEVKERTIETQKLFLQQMKSIAADTQHPGILAIVAFLESTHTETDEQTISALNELKVSAADWITFQVENFDGLAVQWPELKEWWVKQQNTEKQNAPQKKKSAVCLVTGELCVPVDAHGTGLKVIPNGNTSGVALVSGDKDAFSSYGMKKARISPMSEIGVEAYTRAINFMGRDPDYHYRTKETIYLFFPSEEITVLNPAKAVEWGGLKDGLYGDDNSIDGITKSSEDKLPVPIVAVKVYKSPYAGKLSGVAANSSTRFYSLALSGNAARAIVRGWIDIPLTEACANVESWFNELKIILDRPVKLDKKILSDRGNYYQTWPLWRLLSNFKTKGKDSEAEMAKYRYALWEASLLGRNKPLPISLLILVTKRIGVEGDCNPERAALIRLILNRIYKTDNQYHNTNKYMKSELNPLDSSVAYHCGRMFRLLSRIQKEALGDLNATIVDKYYAGASASPATVMGKLLIDAQKNHISKISNDKKRRGYAKWYDTRLTNISNEIIKNHGFPTNTDPVQQGEFALGFYFENTDEAKGKSRSEKTEESQTNDNN